MKAHDGIKNVIIVGSNNNIGHNNEINLNKVEQCPKYNYCSKIASMRKCIKELKKENKIKTIIINILLYE